MSNTTQPTSNEINAYAGLIQWTEAAIRQVERRDAASANIRNRNPAIHRSALRTLHSEMDFFVYAAWKVLDYSKWVRSLGLFKSVDFSEIDKFDTRDTRDVRNMHEHVTDYYKGKGRDKDRWTKETPGISIDAVSTFASEIGGRFDFRAFSEAAARLLPELLKEPFPRAKP